jgi:antitoxin PrlF
MSTPLKLDSKGRISIAKQYREKLGLKPGGAMFLEVDEDTGTFQIRKAINPFDILALDAIRQYEAGETILLRDIAREADIDLDDER